MVEGPDSLLTQTTHHWDERLQDYSLKGKYETATDVTFSQWTEIYSFTKKWKVDDKKGKEN